MFDFVECRLGDIIELKRGYDLPKSQRTEGDVPIISSSGISGWHGFAMVSGPGVVTGRYGTLGQVFYEEKEYWPLNTTLYVRNFKGNDARFVFYFLKTLDFGAYSDKAAVPGLNRNDLHTASILFPPDITYQKRVAQLLSALDDKIDLNRRMNETLEGMARALFKDWFVDFGPTRAKMAGQKPYLAQDIWDMFPNQLDDDGKPVGWEVVPISDLCRIISGKRPPNKEASPSLENPIPVYGGNGISWFTNDTLFEERFLVTGRVGTLGTVFRIFERCWVSDNALCLMPKNKSFLEYMYFTLLNLDFQSLNSGSTQPLLTQRSLGMQRCIIPNQAIMDRYHDQAFLWFDTQNKLEKQNQSLAQTRDLLLPKLMSGEIHIKDAEKMVEDIL